MPLNAMSSTYVHPPRDPDVAAIVEQLSERLAALPDELDWLQSLAASGRTLAEVRGISPDELDALYGVGNDLCNEGSFHHALPIALQLVLHEPREPRYSFMAGSCLQRQNQPEQAVLLFAQTLMLRPGDAAAAYRLGECLLAMDRKEEAREVLLETIELCRENERYRKLYDLATERLGILNC
jgi:predicted Zn-dependent protease